MLNSNDHRQQALAQPLVLGNCEAVVTDDIDLLAEHISLAVPLRDIAVLGPQQQFRHRSSYRIAGDMGLTAATSTPTRMWVDESSDCAMVLLSQGDAVYEIEGKTYPIQAGRSAMFLPGMDYKLDSSLSGGLIYNLSPSCWPATSVKPVAAACTSTRRSTSSIGPRPSTCNSRQSSRCCSVFRCCSARSTAWAPRSSPTVSLWCDCRRGSTPSRLPC